MTSMIERHAKVLDAEYLERRGWPVPEVATERKIARQLAGWKVQPAELQHRVGRYRLDLAWPAERIAVEVDGWHHDRPDVAARDWERHRWLTRQGWLMVHVDPDSGSWPDVLVHVARLLDR